MKRILIALAGLALGISSAYSADENVRAAQTRLKETGFYFGEVTGTFDNDTSAAVSRYQIRNGLQITGQLDAETAKSLGVKAVAASEPATAPDSGSWRRLRKTDQQFLQARGAKPERSTRAATKTAAPPPPASDTTTGTTQRSAPAEPAPSDASYGSVLVLSRERLRDYVGAFVLAGIDPRVGAELEFFGDHVDYYDKGTIGRDRIRADLERYNQRWPQRRFWLDGQVDVQPQADSRVRVTFPLRYELRRGAERSSGKVRKTLLLEVVGDDLQIVGVNERKMR